MARNSDSELFVNLNIRSFDEILRIFTFGFISRVIASNNVLISNIYNSPCRLYSNIWTQTELIYKQHTLHQYIFTIFLQFIYLRCLYYLHNYFTDSIYTTYFIFLAIIYGLCVCNKHLNINIVYLRALGPNFAWALYTVI